MTRICSFAGPGQTVSDRMEPATLGEDFLQPFKSHAVLEIGNVEMVMRCKGFVMTNPASGGIPPLNSSTIMIGSVANFSDD